MLNFRFERLILSPQISTLISLSGSEGSITIDDQGRFRATGSGLYVVHATDEMGNASQTQVEVSQAPLIGRAAPEARNNGGRGCQQSMSPPMLYVFCLLGLFSRFARSRRLFYLSLIPAFRECCSRLLR